MEIVIFRHGKPKIGNHGRVSAAGFGQWIAVYDTAGIDNAHIPSPVAIMKAKSCSIVVCSNLPRSIESAATLGVKSVEIQDALFRECDMPYVNWSHPKLPVSVWLFTFRLLQMLGYSSNAESFKEARGRANRCAVWLVELAQQHGSVAFVGHGSLNWLISKDLLRMGWVGPRNPGREYWEFGVYRYQHGNVLGKKNK